MLALAEVPGRGLAPAGAQLPEDGVVSRLGGLHVRRVVVVGLLQMLRRGAGAVEGQELVNNLWPESARFLLFST